MENKIIQNISHSLAVKLNHYNNKEGLEFTKMKYGMEVFLINISKLIIMYLLAALLGVLPQTLIIHGAYWAVKRYSFGLHALNSTVCTVASCILFVFCPWYLAGMGVGNVVVLAVFSFLILSLYLYAPADTKAMPLIGQKLRARFKKKAVAIGVVLMVIALVIPSESIKLLLTLGAVYQTVSILPLTYKILKRSEKNHEKYEKPTPGQARRAEGEGAV